MSDTPSVEVVLEAEEAAQLYALGEMLNNPSIEVDPEWRGSVPSLSSLLASSGAPLRLESDPSKGLKLVATRDITAGEVILVETALCTSLCRSPGSDGVFSMTDREGRVVATLPPWALLRVFRDTLTFSPEYALRAEVGYGILAQLSALGGREHGGWEGVPSLPPGLESPPLPPTTTPAEEVQVGEGGEEEAPGAATPPRPTPMPPRVQLLQAIAQSNAFCAALPAEDSEWKRGLLWPLLGRIQEVSDRERFFDDLRPFSNVSAFFPLGALFNHSCAPNVLYNDCSWEEGEAAPRITFVAAKDIGAGEEMLHSYIDSGSPVGERRKKLLLTYRFACVCARCVAEGGEVGEEVGVEGGKDPLAKHFPHGRGPEGIIKYYAMGGRFPVDDPDQHPTED